MHLYLYARGINQQVEIWKTLMQSQFWKLRCKRIETGEEGVLLVQGALRPSVLGVWEYVIPKEALHEVLSILGITDDGDTGTIRKFKHDLQLKFLRKILGCKKISKDIYYKAKLYEPSVYFPDKERAMSHCIVPGVAIHIIGIKKDIERDNGSGILQEML